LDSDSTLVNAVEADPTPAGPLDPANVENRNRAAEFV
jgi:hypothetical protein